MPGERSLYRKIQVTLEYAQHSKHNSPEALAVHVYERSPTNFAYYWRGEDDKIRHDYSKSSISSTVALCVDLGLISGQTGRLTQIGVSAIDPRRFPQILGNRVAKFLGKQGFDLSSIADAITKLLHSNEPSPPSSGAIWLEFGEQNTMSQAEFKRLLNLLGECKLIWMSQKRIYLPLPKSG